MGMLIILVDLRSLCVCRSGVVQFLVKIVVCHLFIFVYIISCGAAQLKLS